MSKIADHNEKLRTNQRKAVEALATGRTMKQAAVEAGVTVRTVYSWRAEPDFQRALRELNSAALDDAATVLASTAVRAVRTLKTIMVDKEISPRIRVAAAKAILDSVLKIKELHDFDSRLAEIERTLNEQQTPTRTN